MYLVSTVCVPLLLVLLLVAFQLVVALQHPSHQQQQQPQEESGMVAANAPPLTSVFIDLYQPFTLCDRDSVLSATLSLGSCVLLPSSLSSVFGGWPRAAVSYNATTTVLEVLSLDENCNYQLMGVDILGNECISTNESPYRVRLPGSAGGGGGALPTPYLYSIFLGISAGCLSTDNSTWGLVPNECIYIPQTGEGPSFNYLFTVDDISGAFDYAEYGGGFLGGCTGQPSQQLSGTSGQCYQGVSISRNPQWLNNEPVHKGTGDEAEAEAVALV